VHVCHLVGENVKTLKGLRAIAVNWNPKITAKINPIYCRSINDTITTTRGDKKTVQLKSLVYSVIDMQNFKPRCNRLMCCHIAEDPVTICLPIICYLASTGGIPPFNCASGDELQCDVPQLARVDLEFGETTVSWGFNDWNLSINADQTQLISPCDSIGLSLNLR